jgi:hypothetical protein
LTIVAIVGRGVHSDFRADVGKIEIREENFAHRQRENGEIVRAAKGASRDFSEKNGRFLEKIRPFGRKKASALLSTRKVRV